MPHAVPIRYIEPVFRPPSEAESLILPVTDGCSWNHCTFCEMYTAPQKRFRARDEAEVLADIRRTGERFGGEIRRVFLADGDALVLPTRRLLNVLNAIRTHLPAVRRVSSYCLPRNLRRKTVDELRELAAAGLSIAYVGAESGDDEVLERVNKGEMECLLDRLKLERTVFRSDHASNWLVLKGTLSADKQRLLQQVRETIARPEAAMLRPAWARGL
jgi:radical SAM superfamily enzyme YgiQ (UPF0313 family)